MKTAAAEIMARVCNEHRNSDLRADHPAVLRAFDERIAAVERERDEKQRLNECFRDAVGECHLMISRDTSEYQVRANWDPTDLPPRLQRVMRELEAARAALRSQPDDARTAIETIRKERDELGIALVQARAEVARIGRLFDELSMAAKLFARDNASEDTQRINWLERYEVIVRDGAELVFFRAPGASPLRGYIDDCRKSEDSCK